MLEKFLLAVILTFALAVFTKLSWFSPNQTAGEMNLQNHAVFTLTERDN